MHKHAYVSLLLLISQSIFAGSTTIRSSRSSSSSSSSSSRDDDRSSSSHSRSSESRREESRSTTVEDIRREEPRSVSCSSTRSSTRDDDYEERRERDYYDSRAAEEKKRIEDEEWNNRDWEERRRAQSYVAPTVLAQLQVTPIVQTQRIASPVVHTQRIVESVSQTTQQVDSTTYAKRVVPSPAKQEVVVEKKLTEAEIAHAAVVAERYAAIGRACLVVTTKVGKLIEGQLQTYWPIPEKSQCANIAQRLIAADVLDQQEKQKVFKPELISLSQAPTFTRRDVEPEQDLKYFDHNDKILERLQRYRFQKVAQQTDKITVFIPTREFYELNKDLFSVPREYHGHPVFIPEKFKNSEASSGSVMLKEATSNGSNLQAHVTPAHGSGSMPPLDPKDPKNSQGTDAKDVIIGALTATAYMVGAAMVGTAECAGTAGAMAVTAPLAPVVVGTVLIGCYVSVSIPGFRDPVVVRRDLDTRHMTQVEYDQYIKAKAQYDQICKNQNLARQAVEANKVVFQNGRYAKSQFEGDPIIDGRPVDPSLHYHYGNGQRLLDISTGVPGSTDRIVVQDDKIIKFTRHICGNYTAAVVEDLTTLSRKDKAALRDCFNFEVKQKLKKQEQQQRKNDANRNKNSGPGPDKDPNKNNKDAKRGFLGYIGDKAKKKLDEMEAAKAAKDPKASTVAPKLNSRGKPMKYTGASYHHKNSSGGNQGGKSPGPIDGQKSLNDSLLCKEKGTQGYERRVGVEEDYYIIFDEQRPGEYHGHREIWDKLEDDVQNVLYYAGIVKNRKTGRR